MPDSLLTLTKSLDMKKEISTSIDINASKEKVWDVLLDFKNYPVWNPFITSISGDFEVGSQLDAEIGSMKFKPFVLVSDEQKEFRWIGKLVMKGIFDGEHQFFIQEKSDGSIIFHQNEKFSGILVRLFSKKLDSDTKRGFEEMNKALKLRVENFEN